MGDLRICTGRQLRGAQEDLTVLPQIIYCCFAWFPKFVGRKKGHLAYLLERAQGRAAKAITGAFKATSLPALNVQAFLPLIDHVLEQLALRAMVRMLSTLAYEAVVKIRKGLSNRSPAHEDHEGNERADAAAEKATGLKTSRHRGKIIERGGNDTAQKFNLGSHMMAPLKLKMKKEAEQRWITEWKEESRGKALRRVVPTPLKEVLGLIKDYTAR